MKIQKKFNLIIFVVLTCASCSLNSQLTPSNTPTPKPTASPYPTPTATPDYENLLSTGWEALSEEDYNEAERIAEDVLAINDQYGEAWMLRGLVKHYREQYRDAIPDLDQAKSLGAEEVGKAIEQNYMRIMLELYEDMHETWDINLILEYINESYQIINLLMDLFPDSPFVEAFYPMFTRLPDEGADVSGIDDKAIEHFLAAEDYFSQGSIDLAILEYQTAIDIDPNFSLAHLYLGDAYYMLGDFPNAEIHIKTAVATNPLMPQGWAFLGDTYQNLQLPQHARDSYVRALILDKENRIAKSGFEQLSVFSSWEEDFFDEYGFKFHFPQTDKKELLELPDSSKHVVLYYDDLLIDVSWRPINNSFEGGFEENLVWNLFVINSITDAENGATVEVLTEEAYDFKYGVTSIAVQPYFYSPANEDYKLASARATAHCDNYLISLHFEILANSTDGLDLFLAKYLESLRCNLEGHEWFSD